MTGTTLATDKEGKATDYLLHPDVTAAPPHRSTGAPPGVVVNSREDGGIDSKSTYTAAPTGEGAHDGINTELVHGRKNTWLGAACIVTGEIMGVGVMALPGAVKQLGWIVGLGALLVFGILALYAGYLLSRVRNQYYPHATSFADVAQEIGGRRWYIFTSVCIILQWGLSLPYYEMSAASALRTSFYESDLCYWQWALVVCALAIVPIQMRQLRGFSILALLSSASIIVAVGVILAASAQSGGDGGAQSLWPPPADFLDGYNTLSSMIFAFQGQTLFLEIMHEMQRPQDFPKTISLATGVMYAVYTTTIAAMYSWDGDTVPGFLPDVLGLDVSRRVVGILLAYHVLVSYLITNQCLCHKIHGYIWPQQVLSTSWKAKVQWFGINLGFLIFSFIVANLVPFFSDFTNIYGALGGAPAMFLVPALFYLKAASQHGDEVSRFDYIMCFVFIYIIAPFTTIVGTVSASRQLYRDWNKFGAPFSCVLVGYGG